MKAAYPSLVPLGMAPPSWDTEAPCATGTRMVAVAPTGTCTCKVKDVPWRVQLELTFP